LTQTPIGEVICQILFFQKFDTVGIRLVYRLLLSFGVYLAIMSHFVAGTLIFNLSADEPTTASDCASMLEHLRNNYAAVSSFDVLISYERQKEAEKFSSTFRRSCRVALEPSANRLSYISVKEEIDNVSEGRRTMAVACMVDEVQAKSCSFIEPPQVVERRDFGSYLYDDGVANPFMVGVGFFPDATYDSAKVDLEWDGDIGAIRSYGSVTTSGRDVIATVEFPFVSGKSGENSTRLEYVFDIAKYLPVSCSCWYLNRQSGKTKTHLRYKSRIEWGEPSPGIYLPVSMLIQENGVIRKGATFAPSRSVTSVDFKWHSVNTSTSSKMWDASLVFDFAAALDLCDFPSSPKK
jgi:hypothetical protein